MSQSALPLGSNGSPAGSGRVVQVIGPVVDVEFSAGLPEINTALAQADQAAAGGKAQSLVELIRTTPVVFEGRSIPLRASAGVRGYEPGLEPAQSDRDITVNGLKERYAAIWALADSGATLEQMARATSQPIGQIELILGLRRQIDGPPTRIPHAPHT